MHNIEKKLVSASAEMKGQSKMIKINNLKLKCEILREIHFVITL